MLEKKKKTLGKLSTNVHSQLKGQQIYKVPKLHCAKGVCAVHSHPFTEK